MPDVNGHSSDNKGGIGLENTRAWCILKYFLSTSINTCVYVCIYIHVHEYCIWLCMCVHILCIVCIYKVYIYILVFFPLQSSHGHRKNIFYFTDMFWPLRWQMLLRQTQKSMVSVPPATVEFVWMSIREPNGFVGYEFSLKLHFWLLVKQGYTKVILLTSHFTMGIKKKKFSSQGKFEKGREGAMLDFILAKL